MMSFSESISRGLRGTTDFTGLATRAEFWWFMLFVSLVSIVAAIFDVGMGYGAEVLGPAGAISLLATALPSLSVGTRRLHDIGRSGWWQLIVFLPIAGVVLLIIWWCRPSPATTVTAS